MGRRRAARTMQLVGNDVVDLADPENGEAHLRPRFVARVCTDAERAVLAAAADPLALLWSLFAAKEAAYKVAARLGPDPGFAHRRFAVAPDLHTVRYGALVLDLVVHVDAAAGLVHAVAATGRAAAALRGVTLRRPGEDEGTAARRALRAAVARSRLWRIADLAVVRDPAAGGWTGAGPPHLLHRGRPLAGACVSLSHDGRFAGFAAFAGTPAALERDAGVTG